MSVAATEQTLAEEAAAVKDEDEGAFRRMLLEQHEVHLLAAQHQLHGHGKPALAEWLAMVQQHAAAAAAAAGGDAAQIRAASMAAAAMHHPAAASMGLIAPPGQMMGSWPGVPMLSLFQALAMQHSMLSALIASQHVMAPHVLPLFATAGK